MSETSMPPGATSGTPPAAARNRHGLRIALGASLALNVAIIGLVLGAVLSHAPRPSRGHNPGEVHHHDSRILEIGPYGRALSREDRRAILTALEPHRETLREDRQAVREGFDRILDLLRSEHLDATALRSMLADQRSRAARASDLVADVLVAQVSAMSPAERAAFADRLEHALRRGPDR